MNLRWLLGNYSDPKYRLPRTVWWPLCWEAHENHLSTSRFVVWTVGFVIAPVLAYIGLGVPYIHDLIGFAGEPDEHWFSLIQIMVFSWIWSAWIYRALYVKPVRRAMRDRGYDLCVSCGYDLKGIESPQCPECGAQREPMPDPDDR